ncbi:NAD(P)-dependent oxidoreductase [Streptomyces polygonati]|uniref:NAD(P)-dependent oxidoreductase n=1 Tax=Streptomyces polygonati TaxID=1617087 RepID=A0ABV8HWN0_9ACTN
MQRRAHIVVLDPVHDEALNSLRRDHDVSVRLKLDQPAVPAAAADADVLVVRSGVKITAEVIRAAPRLKLIARAGSGTDNIDLDACREAGVRVFTLPGMSAGAVAELALGLMLAVCRHIPLADRQIRAGIWDKPRLAGPELEGRTLGMIGLGAIGSRIVRLAHAFGMTVTASVQRPTPERTDTLAERDIALAPLDELLTGADVVCLAVPLTPGTTGLIGAAELGLMRPDAYLVNVSRGGVVNEHALFQALSDRTIAGAALDVHAVESGVPELAALDNVVLTPHIGATTNGAQQRLGRALVDRLTLALAGMPVPTEVR